MCTFVRGAAVAFPVRRVLCWRRLSGLLPGPQAVYWGLNRRRMLKNALAATAKFRPVQNSAVETPPPLLVFESCRPLKLDDRVLPRNGHSIPGSRPSFPFKCQMGPKTPPGGRRPTFQYFQLAGSNQGRGGPGKHDANFEKTAFLERQETTLLLPPPWAPI